MMFCPKCGSLLRPKADKKKKILACSCGYTNKEVESAKIQEKVEREERAVSVVEENDDMLPEMDAECPECGNGRAKYWLKQMRAGDEPETKFLKCTKCKHVWRDYD
ncbi:transcription factor S [Candidatus Woesearchaeota archaeon]|nr:transcription factor S [Candidatus Woesearchaeota archaeon]